MTFTVTIVDPSEKTSRFVDQIYAIAKPEVPKQIRGGVYEFTVPMSRTIEVQRRLNDISPGDVEVKLGRGEP